MANDMPETEYFMLFGEEGDYSVEVKFEKSKASVAERRASAKDITTLLRLLDLQEQPVMTFDDHFGSVTSIQINPLEKRLALLVQLL